jgi:DNA-binding NarL/FixJ family response regulator
MAWAAAAKAWESLGRPYNAGYARWRQAPAQLDAGQPVTAVTAALRAAAASATRHAPLTAQIRGLAERARVPLRASQPSRVAVPARAGHPAPYGFTARELNVRRLLAASRTNGQVGAELYISPKTASVHVTAILPKLGVSGRVQTAALAERAGISRDPQSNGP